MVYEIDTKTDRRWKTFSISILRAIKHKIWCK